MELVDGRIEPGVTIIIDIPFLRGVALFPMPDIVKIKETVHPNEFSIE